MPAITSDDGALEDLDALTPTFDHAHVHLDVVAGAEVRDVVAEVPCLDLIKRVHRESLQRSADGRPAPSDHNLRRHGGRIL